MLSFESLCEKNNFKFRKIKLFMMKKFVKKLQCFVYLYFVYNLMSLLNETHGFRLDIIKKLCSQIKVCIISHNNDSQLYVLSHRQWIYHVYLFMLLRQCFSVLLSVIVNNRLWQERESYYIESLIFVYVFCILRVNIRINISPYTHLI